MPTLRGRTSPDEALRHLEKVGLIPPAMLTDVLELLRERAAGGPVYRWEIRGQSRLAVFDPLLAGETARPRVHALALPRPHGPRERRWASSFVAESVHGGGLRTTRLSEAAESAWNSLRQSRARARLLDDLLARYSPGALRPLGRDLRDHAHRLTVFWTEGHEDEESVRLLGRAVAGDELAARLYRQRLDGISGAAHDSVLSRLGETDPETLDDAALFSEITARVFGDLLGAMGRVLCTVHPGGSAALLEHVLSNDPPWWIHVRETTHDYRLGVHRLPPRARIFITVPLLTVEGTESTVCGHMRALALGANLCPSLLLLLQHARDLDDRLAAVGRLEPVLSVHFIEANGASVSDTMGVHVRR